MTFLLILIAIVVGGIMIAAVANKPRQSTSAPPQPWQPPENRRTKRRLDAPLAPITLASSAIPQQQPANIASASEPGRFWTVDLNARTCTCPDFAKRRAHLSQTDARRLCKHAITVLIDRGLTHPLSPMMHALLEDDFFTRYDGIHSQEIGGIAVAIAFRDGEKWINLFAPDGPGSKSYARFGYDLHERRWAYGTAPRWVKGASATIRSRFIR